jgi:S-adenosylmethionine:diacylglycerol 3-amino-3-carboxypropyl transferase
VVENRVNNLKAIGPKKNFVDRLNNRTSTQAVAEMILVRDVSVLLDSSLHYPNIFNAVVSKVSSAAFLGFYRNMLAHLLCRWPMQLSMYYCTEVTVIQLPTWVETWVCFISGYSQYSL